MSTAPATEATADDPALAAVDLLGKERAGALGMLRDAQKLAEEAERILVLADLREAAAKIAPCLPQAEAARAAAEEALSGPWAELQRLEGELAEVGRRAANLEAVVAGEPDLDRRLEARRSLGNVFADEAEAIRGRIARHRSEVIAPLQAAVTQARAAEDTERELASYALEAMEDPLGHPLGQSMASYQLRLVRTWGVTLLTGDEHHPDWPEAIRWLKTALRASGAGEQIQRDAIAADHAGLVKDTGITKHFADGSTLIQEPGKPPLVSQRASAEQLRSLPPRPAVDTSTGADVAARAWAQTGYHREQHTGLPGVHHPTQPRYPPAGGTIGK